MKTRLIVSALFLATMSSASADPALDRLKSDLLGGGSATQVLTQWCGNLKLAAPPVIKAEQIAGTDSRPDAAIRALLQAKSDDVIRHRRVRLMCGARVLSVADNWYRPDRLTDAMNRTLEHSDTSFGTVVRPLNFHRRTLAADSLNGPEGVLRIRALLLRADGAPFSYVIETYSRTLVSGPAP